MNGILINMQITGRYTIHSYINKACEDAAVLGELKDQLLTNLDDSTYTKFLFQA